MENQQYRILVVDDNTKNVQLLASLLSGKAYDVDYALSGLVALEMVNSEKFDLILLDIMMPEMDGFEVCEKLKQDENTKEVPIIFLTAKTDIESIKKAFQYGGLDYVSKPFNADELLSRVETHIKLKVSQDKLKDLNKWLDDEVKKKTSELNEANKKLLELDNAKSQFLQIISHEIRTPLNGILGSIQLFKKDELSEKALNYFNILDLSSKRLEEFAYKAIDISQFNMYGSKHLHFVNINLNDILNSVLSELKKVGDQKGISISQSIDIDNPVIEADPDYLHKCIFNILSNAIIYSPENGSVFIDTRIENKQLQIEIKDEGVGFENELIINDIELFDTKKHIDSNPGLSLYLSNQIIKAHGGTIVNGNNKDKGAFVKISIPIMR